VVDIVGDVEAMSAWNVWEIVVGGTVEEDRFDKTLVRRR